MALEAELKELKLGGLSSRAVAMGIDPDDVADAQDQDNPSEAVRSLITECERLKGELGQLKLGVPRPLLYPLSIIVPIPTTNTPTMTASPRPPRIADCDFSAGALAPVRFGGGDGLVVQRCARRCTSRSASRRRASRPTSTTSCAQSAWTSSPSTGSPQTPSARTRVRPSPLVAPGLHFTSRRRCGRR